MILFDNITQNWSRYEINSEILLLLSMFLISLITIYLSTKNKRLLILSTISFLVAALSNLIGILFVNILFNIPISSLFRIIPIVTSILLVSNLGILIGFYISISHKKGFKIEDIIKEYYSDSVKQTVFLLLLGMSTLLFLSVQTEAIVAISILSTTAAIWFTYWISKYILK